MSSTRLVVSTWWAYLLYAVVLGGILYIVRRSELHRQALKTNLALEKVEADKLKELDSFKSRLYTNLTHEFRTPLTVILGMAEQIKRAPQKHLDDGVELIRNNGKNLLQLINQLLDLSKLESGAFQLQLRQGDVVPYLRYLAESFQTYANSRNLSLRFPRNAGVAGDGLRPGAAQAGGDEPDFQCRKIHAFRRGR
ncbi:MAG: HAMP domain-containing histidine kinase [Lewinellaceae bacterium]|nr:HAMP domain-containing histidine kinase [Lewinellaceae bacterium]